MEALTFDPPNVAPTGLRPAESKQEIRSAFKISEFFLTVELKSNLVSINEVSNNILLYVTVDYVYITT